MTHAKWHDGAWRDESGRPVCVRCNRILSSHYTLCVHCKTELSRSQMDAADAWERWNKERFDRAAQEPDQDKRAAILKETYAANVQSKEKQ